MTDNTPTTKQEEGGLAYAPDLEIGRAPTLWNAKLLGR